MNERLYEERLKEEEAQRRYQERTSRQNISLANEMQQSRANDERKLVDIQRICDDSPELKELERALKLAYLNKDRFVQAQENLYLKQKEEARVRMMEEQMENDRLDSIRNEADKEGEKRAMHENQRLILEKQIKEREEMRREADKQTEIDRQNVELIMRRINEEDDEDMRRKRAMQEATAKMVRDYEEQRKRELQMKRAAEQAEEDRITAYNRAVEARSAGVAERKQLKREEDDRVFRHIVEETQRKQAEEDEFNYLRDMLWEEELEAKREQDVRGRRDRQDRMKREMMVANSEMLAYKEQSRLQEAEAEARMVAIMRRKFAEDEMRERAEAEARRLAKQRHMALIEEQKRMRRNMDVSERMAELAQLEEEGRREEYRRQVVHEARKRLLAEHAAKLKDFIHGGVFKDKEEYEHFIKLADAEL
jgi:hypothetical protein